MIEYRNEYISAAEYAKRCGITTRTVYNRIKAGTLWSLQVDGFYFINTLSAPTVSRINPHQKHNMQKVVPTAYFNWKEWRNVTSYAYEHRITAGVIFRLMITNKIDGIVLGDEVFFKPSQLPK